jgi:hypothetical protein
MRVPGILVDISEGDEVRCRRADDPDEVTRKIIRPSMDRVRARL